MACVLNLLTNETRPTVRINGVEYEMRLSSDFTIEEYRRFETLGPRLAALLLQETLSAGEAVEREALADEGCRLALVAPEVVLARLGGPNRIAILEAFITLSTPSRQPTGATTAPAAKPSSGTRSSRGSSGSSAGRRPSGSGKRRSAS